MSTQYQNTKRKNTSIRTWLYTGNLLTKSVYRWEHGFIQVTYSLRGYTGDRFNLIQYYKIFNNLTSLHHADYFSYHQPSPFTRNPSPFLIKPLNCPNYLLTSFFYRSLDCWNSLPPELRQIKSLNSFKSQLLKVNLNNFFIGSVFNSYNL